MFDFCADCARESVAGIAIDCNFPYCTVRARSCPYLGGLTHYRRFTVVDYLIVTTLTYTHTCYSDLQAHTSDRRWEFTCASSDINFRWGVWTGETTHVRDPFTILCPQGTYIGGVASRYIKVEDDRVWELLCNRLPEGRELGSCGWTFFMNQPFQNLTLPTLRHMTILKGMKTRLIFHQ